MDSSAYEAMYALQSRHWWWRGMSWLYNTALHTFLPASKGESRRLIDIGCGFGTNLPILNALGDVVGVDVSLEALQAIQQRPRLGLVQARADALPFKPRSFDVVALLAVIEHVDRDDTVLSEAHRIARPGAIQLLNTSAFMVLWSHHDLANQHRRRYRVAQLRLMQAAAGWRVLVISYVNTLIFPAVLVVRLLQRLAKKHDEAEYDMGPEFRPLNAFLEIVLKLESWLILKGHMPMPWGVDIISVSRRDD